MTTTKKASKKSPKKNPKAKPILVVKKKAVATRKARVHREENPLVISVTKEEFADWKTGRRIVEYRKVSSRWDGSSCTVGRQVQLAIGTQTAPRLRATIKAVSLIQDDAIDNIPPSQMPEGAPDEVLAVALSVLRPLTKEVH